MQRYQTIIERLTESQRIRLLTNFTSLQDPAMTALGVPAVTMESLLSVLAGHHPSPLALARTWDKDLVTAAIAHACRTAGEHRDASEAGRLCLRTPSAKAAVGCVDDSLSEDPLLSGEMAGAVLQGVRNAGQNACMEGYGTRRGNRREAAAWASRPAARLSPRVLTEQLDTPFAAALKAPCLGIIADSDMEIPEMLQRQSEVRILRRSASDEETIRAITRGEILLEGSAVALQSALHNYRRLQRDLRRGKATMEESNAAIAAGEAISEETVNEALERLLSFAEACVSRQSVPDTPPDDTLTERAFAGMTVLLENTAGLLPFTKKKTKFCIIGAPGASCRDNPALTALYPPLKFTCLGYAAGYDPALERSDELIDPAVALAKQADMVLLFLSAQGVTEGGSLSTLPANRVALFDRVSRLKKKLVVILDAEGTPDIRFLRYAATRPDAILLAPLHMEAVRDGVPLPVGATYAMETLFGVRSPAGRLTAGLVDPTDRGAVRGHLPDGPFLGYRYYDTVGSGVLYPFGHGLSYTSFKYGDLLVEGEQVIFTVTNSGKRAGVAVPQVYIGKDGSAVLRPRKELVAYTKVELAPGASATVTLPILPRPVRTETGVQYEAGDYTVYIGESVSDIRLIHHLRFSGDDLSPDGLVASDYLPTVSNIFTEHYTLEAEYTPMKASLRNPLFGIAALVLAACIEIIGLVADAQSVYPDIIAAVLAVGAIVFLIMEMVDRKRQFAREQERLEEINSILYADARKIPAPTADALFAETPDDGAEAVVETPVRTETPTGEYDHFADVDATLTIPEAARELRQLAREKGVDLDADTTNAIFAAFASGRLLVLKNMDNDRFHSLLFVLCEYFGCPVCMDYVDESYVSESAAVLGPDGTTQRGLLSAIYSAQNRVRHMQITALCNVTWADISNYFVPFAAYARAPFSACHLALHDHTGRALSYHLPKNLWFILNLKSGESLDGIPDYIADVATVHNWSVLLLEPSASISEFRPFYYGQMIYLSERVKSAFAMDEEVWKKIDRLESFVNEYAEFRIGNKLWLGMETYLAVLAAAGVEVPEALDEALAVKLLPVVIHVLAGKIPRDRKNLGEALDGLLGEDRTAVCRRTIKESGADIM